MIQKGEKPLIDLINTLASIDITTEDPNIPQITGRILYLKSIASYQGHNLAGDLFPETTLDRIAELSNEIQSFVEP